MIYSGVCVAFLFAPISDFCVPNCFGRGVWTLLRLSIDWRFGPLCRRRPSVPSRQTGRRPVPSSCARLTAICHLLATLPRKRRYFSYSTCWARGTKIGLPPIGQAVALSDRRFGCDPWRFFGRDRPSRHGCRVRRDPRPLYDLIHDQNVDQFIRGAMCETVAIVTLQGNLPREEAAKFLRARAIRSSVSQGECWVWHGWQAAIAVLGLVELEPLVEEAFARADSSVAGGSAGRISRKTCSEPCIISRRCRRPEILRFSEM